MDDPTPPARKLGLRPREVAPSDTSSRPGDGTEISVPLMLQANRLAEERLAREGRGIAPVTPPAEPQGPSPFKQAEFTPVDPPAQPGDESVITVDEILRQNQVAARESASELIAMPARRRSRRNRDFALIVGVAVATALALVVTFRHDLPVIGLALSAIGFVTLIFAWILFGVMDKY